MLKKGKLIVLEAVGGAGKTTCIEFLRKNLPIGKFVFTHEPGGTEASEEIRKVVLKEERNPPLHTLTEILLFEAARAEHVRRVISPAIEDGKHVICDRFSPSTYAYQLAAGDEMGFYRLFNVIESAVLDGLMPDIFILLDVDPRTALERKMSQASGEEDKFDTMGTAFQDKVRQGLKDYLRGRNHVIVDASRYQEYVLNEVLGIVNQVVSS